MRILAVSPHLDDAIFSAGGTLASMAKRGAEVLVVTCFAGNVRQPSGFALACQLDKGIERETDYMALRRAEDVAACEMIGARAQHLMFLEAPHRGYGSAEALFGPRLAIDNIGSEVSTRLAQTIAEFRPDLVLGPLAVGGHVDHLIVRDALRSLVTAARLCEWEDYPYAMREDPAPAIKRHALEESALERKISAMLCYRSQLGFQFGGADAAQGAFRNWGQEGFDRDISRALRFEV